MTKTWRDKNTEHPLYKRYKKDSKQIHHVLWIMEYNLSMSNLCFVNEVRVHIMIWYVVNTHFVCLVWEGFTLGLCMYNYYILSFIHMIYYCKYYKNIKKYGPYLYVYEFINMLYNQSDLMLTLIYTIDTERSWLSTAYSHLNNAWW